MSNYQARPERNRQRRSGRTPVLDPDGEGTLEFVVQLPQARFVDFYGYGLLSLYLSSPYAEIARHVSNAGKTV
jgi:hypothetical protein